MPERAKEAGLAQVLGVSVTASVLLAALFPVTFGRSSLAWGILPLAVWVVFVALWIQLPILRSTAQWSLRLLFLSTFVSLVSLLHHPIPQRQFSPAGKLWVEQSSHPTAISHPPANRSTANRVVWVVFDELDQKLAFETVPGEIHLPAFTRMRNESFAASNAVPSGYRTLGAIPSMLTGRIITSNAAVRSRYFPPDSSQPRYWGTIPNLFSEFKLEEKSSSVLGWYHPYCSVLQAEVSKCFTVLDPLDPYVAPKSPLVLAAFDIQQVFRSFPGMRTLRRMIKLQAGLDVSDPEMHKQRYRAIVEHLEEFLTYPSDFLFVHLPLPHLPGVGHSGEGDYFDNLELADKILGNIRNILERSPRWSQTTLLVTGDHHFRYRYWADTLEAGNLSKRTLTATGGSETFRTVCLIRFPDDNAPIQYSAPFNAVLLHDLVRSISSGHLRNAEQVAVWMEGARKRFSMEPPPVE